MIDPYELMMFVRMGDIHEKLAITEEDGTSTYKYYDWYKDHTYIVNVKRIDGEA